MVAFATAALALAMAPPARAALMLTDSLTDLTTSATSTHTFTDNQAGDADPALVYAANVGQLPHACCARPVGGDAGAGANAG